MQQIREFWSYVWSDATARLVFALTLLVILVLVAIYLVQKVRRMVTGEPLHDVNENLTHFWEMKEKGLIDEQEFKRVRTMVTQPVNDTTSAPGPNNNPPDSA